MTNHTGMDGRGSRTPPGHKTMKGDDFTAFYGAERTEPAAVKGYTIHLTQVGKEWWGFMLFKGCALIGREQHYACLDIAIHEANAFIRRHAEENR
ncbi:hypothetical protein [Nocardioides sp.]|uniref:hypothetical protein n=1 Tax=Nocardioides sp. TaxID=35761 RepID=UPI002B648A2E|nr:hypothetical protein [Nocardioides sp.]HXH79545.1 hypothetical protein [Nocardioides sp.]